jgi:hypothetical protein
MRALGEAAWAGIFACPRWGWNSYFCGGLLVVLVEPVVFLVLCFEVFLAFFAGVVLFWFGVDWLGVAGAVFCAKIIGRLAAAKTIASKLFFMLISPCGTCLSRLFHLAATPVLIR